MRGLGHVGQLPLCDPSVVQWVTRWASLRSSATKDLYTVRSRVATVGHVVGYSK